MERQVFLVSILVGNRLNESSNEVVRCRSVVKIMLLIRRFFSLSFFSQSRIINFCISA